MTCFFLSGFFLIDWFPAPPIFHPSQILQQINPLLEPLLQPLGIQPHESHNLSPIVGQQHLRLSPLSDLFEEETGVVELEVVVFEDPADHGAYPAVPVVELDQLKFQGSLKKREINLVLLVIH